MIGAGSPRRMRVVVDAMAVLTIVSLALASWLFYDRITTSRQTQTSTVAAIRTVLCFAQQRVETDPTVTPQQRQRAIKFYTDALKKVHALPCPPIVRRTS